MLHKGEDFTGEKNLALRAKKTKKYFALEPDVGLEGICKKSKIFHKTKIQKYLQRRNSRHVYVRNEQENCFQGGQTGRRSKDQRVVLGQGGQKCTHSLRGTGTTTQSQQPASQAARQAGSGRPGWADADARLDAAGAAAALDGVGAGDGEVVEGGEVPGGVVLPRLEEAAVDDEHDVLHRDGGPGPGEGATYPPPRETGPFRGP